MINYIVNDSNIQIQINEPDIQMAQDFLLAIHSGCKPDDVIALMPDYIPSKVPPFGRVNAYVTYSDLKKNFESYAKKLCESNFKQVTTTANPLKREINRSWKALANHTEKQVTRWTNFVLDFDRANNATEYPATKEELAEISKAREDVSDFLQSIGFCSPIKASSGNGYYLIYRLELELKEREKSAIEAIYNTISDVISKRSNVKIDKAFFDNLRQNLPIAGTVNRKFPDGQRLRELEDCPELDQIPAIRQANSEAMRFFLATINLKESEDSIYIKGEINDSKYPQRNEAQAAWEQTATWEDVLEGSGATKLRECNGYIQWRRSGKETGGLSFVTGSNKGGRDRLYCFSTNDIFPSGTNLTKYWAYLTVKGWAAWNGIKPSIVNNGAKEQWFKNEVMRRINYSFNDPSEVTNLEPIESEDYEDAPEEVNTDGKSKGSLDNFELPGVLKAIAEYQNNLSTFECMSLAKGTAPWLLSTWIGKVATLWDDLPLNVNGIILAPRSSGKESVVKIIGNTNNLLYRLHPQEIEHIIGETIPLNRVWQDMVNISLSGTKTGSAEGIEELFIKYGRIAISWDEGEGLVISSPKEKANENLDKIRTLINSSLECGAKSTRPIKDEEIQQFSEYRLNCLCVTQINSFFKRLNILGNDNAAKGNLGRYYYVTLNQKGLVNRDHSPSRYEMPPEVIECYLRWRHLNLEGDTQRNYATFKPTSFRKLQANIALINDTDDYIDYLSKESSKLDKGGYEILAAIVSREAEYAKRFMGIFTLAEDPYATHVTQKAWDLGKQFASLSRSVIEKEVANHSKSEWQEKLTTLINKVKANKTTGVSFRIIRNDIGKNFSGVDDLEKHLGHLISTGELVLRKEGKGFKYFLGKK